MDMALEYGTDEWETAYQEILQRRLQEAKKPYVQGTPEWIDAYEKAVQGDEEYREAAAGWEGTVALHTVADPAIGMERDSYILMDLWHGDCRSIRPVPPEAGEAADYVITGSYWTWKQSGKGELDTNKAVMQGKLKLRGDLGTIVRYNKASSRLTELSGQLGGRFLDELDPEEAEKIRTLSEEIYTRLM
jgi:putative sterol carrier protein